MGSWVKMRGPGDPLELLERWLADAEEAGAPVPRTMTLATAAAAGRPSARVVSLKRITDKGLVFTTALWTRKAKELLRWGIDGFFSDTPDVIREAVETKH